MVWLARKISLRLPAAWRRSDHDSRATHPRFRATSSGRRPHRCDSRPCGDGSTFVDLAFTGLRQLANALIAVASLWLVWRVWRRRTSERGSPEIAAAAALAGAALAIAVLVRLSQGLSLAYNSERLVIQLAPVSALAVAIMFARTRGRRPQFARVVMSSGMILTGMLAVADTSGVRGLVTAGSAGNLQTTGGFVQRYYVTPQDMAASTWLEQRWNRDNMVFADRYGALMLREHPTMSAWRPRPAHPPGAGSAGVRVRHG